MRQVKHFTWQPRHGDIVPGDMLVHRTMCDDDAQDTICTVAHTSWDYKHYERPHVKVMTSEGKIHTILMDELWDASWTHFPKNDA